MFAGPGEYVDNPVQGNRPDICVSRDVCGEIKAAGVDVPESLTIEDLVERHKAKLSPKGETYCI